MAHCVFGNSQVIDRLTGQNSQPYDEGVKDVSIAASDFKARCLRLLDEVAQERKSLTITKHGRPVARLVPCESRAEPLEGRWKGRGKIKGDIVYLDTSSDWEALR